MIPLMKQRGDHGKFTICRKDFFYSQEADAYDFVKVYISPTEQASSALIQTESNAIVQSQMQL